MTTEKRYELLCELIREYAKLDDEFGKRMAEDVIHSPMRRYGTTHGFEHFPFYGTAAGLLIDALDGISAKTTPATIAAAVKHILSTNDCRPTLTMLHKLEVNGETRYCACDGFRAIRLKHDLIALPHAKEGELFIDLDSAMDVRPQDELQLPTIQTLKATIAAHPDLKRTKKQVGRPVLLDGKIYVNAYYLLDMLQALPGARAWMTGTDGASPLAPIYMEAENGDGILLPCRPPKTPPRDADDPELQPIKV